MNLLRIPNAAEKIGISRQMLWKLTESGEIATVTIDGVQYVDMDTVTYKPERKSKAGGRPKAKEL